ncbi:polysaccharide export protein [Sphingomonas gei]|uniref:Polysaccharide export protein n=1 Tax=Sphingomonas gei TaxID=1395960 RepID=A0A4S1XC54_9SPHN|nr:polysaccharide biosynthesis/export family protein [Sphingomonas gei]TGX53508.1 polysaccharide export protein [Sphingomonas gei]
MKFRAIINAFALALSVAMPLASAVGATLQSSDERPPIYTLDSGDKIRVVVYGEQSLNGEYSVGPAGDVAFPLIGNLPAKGKSVAELQQAITAKLATGYILDPRVSVEVLSFRPFYILGEVNRPGQYPYATDLSVDQAVATAGGYTYRASKSKIFIRHLGEREVEYKLGKGKVVWVRPGDSIRVGERYF